MVYVNNLRMVYDSGLQLHKVHTYKYKCNINMNRLGVVAFLDKDVVAYFDEGVVACLDKIIRMILM